MNKEEVIENVIKLTDKFYRLNIFSIYDLLKDSGYFELYSEINEQNIYEELAKHPEFIEQWLLWSDNKRSSTGWYIKSHDEKNYIVGYIPSSKKLKTMEYDDVAEGCAAFIVREIDDIMKS